jgi:hypothetical protein
MFRKRKIKDDPLTYKFFETLGPNQDPLYLGSMVEKRDGIFRWESAFGASSGEGPPDVCMNHIQTCARESEALIVIKTMGMR